VEGDELEMGEEKLRILHTPGHSPGGICLVHDDGPRSFVIAGDTLFDGSIGRTDLWGGDFSLLARSIREKIYTLPPETRIYPGHGPETTAGREMKTNPFVNEEGAWGG
jgi:glyoxylase-like metal-dependent hydrolase (beta-lactamase superfamily II)